MPLKTFKQVFSQSLLAFQATFLSLLPSVVFAFSLPLLKQHPALVFLYPVFLSTRGALGGILCGKLSTALHVGWVEPSFKRNTPYFWALLASQAPLSAFVGLVFTLLATLFGGKLLEILVFSLSVSSLAGVTVTLLASSVGIVSFRVGLNPDIILYPVLSSVADLLVTIFFVELARALIYGTLAPLVVLSAILLTIASYTLARFLSLEAFKRSTVEGVISLLLVSIVVAFTGLGLTMMVEEAPRSLIASYAALMDLLGDAGSAFGSLTTTRLAIEGFAGFTRKKSVVLSELAGIAVAYLVMAQVFAVVGSIVVGEEPLRSMRMAFMSSAFSLSLGLTVSFSVAILAYKLGSDPDAYVIPLESCLADMITTYSLLLASRL